MNKGWDIKQTVAGSEPFKVFDGKMSDNLKSCPFCGQTEYLVVGTDIDLGVNGDALAAQGIESGYYTVCCSAERAFNEPPRGCGASNGYYPTRDEAIEKWNRREGKQ